MKTIKIIIPFILILTILISCSKDDEPNEYIHYKSYDIVYCFKTDTGTSCNNLPYLARGYYSSNDNLTYIHAQDNELKNIEINITIPGRIINGDTITSYLHTDPGLSFEYINNGRKYDVLKKCQINIHQYYDRLEGWAHGDFILCNAAGDTSTIYDVFIEVLNQDYQ